MKKFGLDVKKLYEVIKSETDPFVDTFGVVKEDVEVKITSPDGEKETTLVATDGGEGVQVTTVDKAKVEGEVPVEDVVEEVPVKAEEIDAPVEEKKEKTGKPKEVGDKDPSKVTTEGKIPPNPTDATSPEAIKALTEEAEVPAEVPAEEKPAEEEAELTKFEVTDEIVTKVLAEVPEAADVNIDELKKGLEIEQEHADVTGGCPLMTAKIAISHLKEIPDYYTRLVAMEEAAKAEQKPVEEVPAGEVPVESKKKLGEAQEKKEGEKEYTVNIDVQVFAKDDLEATNKISEVIGDKFEYWLGDISLEESKKKINEAAKKVIEKKLKEDIDSIIDAKPILTDALKGIGYDVVEYAIADKEAGEATITVKIKNKQEAVAAEEEVLSTEQPPVEAAPEAAVPAEAPVVEPPVEAPVESKKVTETVAEIDLEEIAKELNVDKALINRIAKELQDKGVGEGKIPKNPIDMTGPDAIKALNEVEEPIKKEYSVIISVSDENVAASIAKDNADKKAFTQKNDQTGKWDVLMPVEEAKVVDEKEIAEKIELVKYLQEQKELTAKQRAFVEENKHLIK